MRTMPKAANTQPPQIAHLSITLDGVAPKVSRIVAVPLGIHLDMLHLVIQAAMGWSNSHLWMFQARGCTWGVPDPDFGYDGGPSDAGRTTLIDMIADIGTNRFEYVYDFGDHWSHTIKIVKPMPAVPGVAYPLLIDAEAAVHLKIAEALQATWICSRRCMTQAIHATQTRLIGPGPASTQRLSTAPSLRKTSRTLRS